MRRSLVGQLARSARPANRPTAARRQFSPLDAAVVLTSRRGHLLRRSAARPGKGLFARSVARGAQVVKMPINSEAATSAAADRSQRCARRRRGTALTPCPSPKGRGEPVCVSPKGSSGSVVAEPLPATPESRSRLRATTRLPGQDRRPTSPRRQSPAPAIVAAFEVFAHGTFSTNNFRNVSKPRRQWLNAVFSGQPIIPAISAKLNWP